MKKFVEIIAILSLLAACGTDDDPNARYQGGNAATLDRAAIFSNFNTIALDNFEYDELFQLINYGPGLESVIASDERPIIAVLDSGFFIDREVFRDRIWTAPPEIDTRCDGRVGCNTAVFEFGDSKYGNSDISPESASRNSFCEEGRADCFHGTSVASLIAGYDAEREALGICPICQIIPIKVTDSTETISDAAIFGALLYISNLKAQGVPVRIVNASFGKYLSSERVALGLRSLPHMDDVLIAAAAGNENSSAQSYPAAWDQIISVASVSYFDGSKSPFSNYGSWVDIAAPSGVLDYVGLTSFPLELNGTSFSAPLVAGTAGLLLAAEPWLSIKQLKERLVSSADATLLYGANPSFTLRENDRTVGLLGSGMLNVGNALTATSGNQLDQEPVISPGCATIGLSDSNHNFPASFLILMLPLILAVRYRN